MSAHHLTVDELSAYLDEELLAPERLGVETHLEDCTDCRERLDGLRSVALGLRSVERLSPPPLLEHSLKRQLSLVDREEPAWRRAPVVGRLQSNLLLLFALVIALALMVALFSDALSRVGHGGSTIVAPPSGGVGFPAYEDAGVVRLEVIRNRVFEVERETWRERGVGAVERWLSVEQASELAAREPVLFELWSDGAATVVLQLATAADPSEAADLGSGVVGISEATASQVLASVASSPP